MTQERIRELLSDVADAVPAPDVAGQAWRRSVRVRRRRVAGTSLLAAGVVAAVVAIVGVVGDGQPGTLPPDQDQVAPAPPVPEAGRVREPDTHIAGAPAWIGPTYEEETRLPGMTSVLPGTIDLAAEDVERSDAPGRSVAAFASSDSEHQLREIMLVDRDGQVSRLDVSDLELDLVEKPDPDSDGVTYVLPLNISSLSPDGKSLVLAQNHEVVLFDLVGGTYESFDNRGSKSYYVGWTLTKDYGLQIQLVKDLMDPDTGFVTPIQEQGGDDESDDDGSVAIWPARSSGGNTAQAVLDRPVPKLASEVGDDPLLIDVEGTQPATLVMPTDDSDHIRPRSRVVDWLDENLVAFQSQDYGTFRVLGWDTESGAAKSLTEFELPDDWDEGVIASWADLGP